MKKMKQIVIVSNEKKKMKVNDCEENISIKKKTF